MLTTEEVARRLGVKPATVYAYVSRGLLSSRRNADGKASRFDEAEVTAFAARRRGAESVRTCTALTLIKDGHLYYRGRDATELAVTRSFEAVATLLWTGELRHVDLRPDPELHRLAGAVTAPLPASARPADRLRVMIAAAATADPMRYDIAPAAVVATARRILATTVAALPANGDPVPGRVPRGGSASGRVPRGESTSGRVSHGEAAPGRISRGELDTGGDVSAVAPPGWGDPAHGLAGELWPKLTAMPPTADRIARLNAALVLLADHDIAASTLAARVAASTRAHPYAVVLAGLAAHDGPRHGAASALAYGLLTEAAAGGDPVGVLADRLRTGRPIPGFGHPHYPAGDPRAAALLALGGDTGSELIAAMAGRSGDAAPNIDLALAAFTLEHDMPADAGEAIFAVARIAGWIAHALEEYADRPLRFRPTGRYTGRRPAR